MAHDNNFLATDLIRHAKWTANERVKVENGVDAGLQVDPWGMPTKARLLFDCLL
jgi:hypothetical protein